MNKTAIKNFATWARKKLIADITYKASLMGITDQGIKSALSQSMPGEEAYDIGTKEPYVITGDAVRQRAHLARLINDRAKGSDYQTAFSSVVEEVAYTWFNRLIAIRFMEVNDYMPDHIRVLSSENGSKLEPDMVTTPFDTELEFTEKEKQQIIQLKNDNAVDELFQMLFIKECNSLNQYLSRLFEKTADYTELLLNVSVTDKEGVVYHLVHDIEEQDFDINNIGEDGRPTGQVEIIGWLYQYYNAEPFSALYDNNEKSKVEKSDLPVATQLFTPDWIVNYLVENSLGKLWTGESVPRSDFHWSHFIVEGSNKDTISEKCRITEIKCLDPCMGSGHILICFFEKLLDIYLSLGYTKRDAVRSIAQNNIYGFDIDKRAYQLAYFSLMMKCRQNDRSFLKEKYQVNLYCLEDSREFNRNQLKYFGNSLDQKSRQSLEKQVIELVNLFTDEKEIGSMIKIESYNWNALSKFVADVDEIHQISLDTIGVNETQDLLERIIEQGIVLSKKYEVIVTNPPYLNANRINATLTKYISKYYPESKQDLCMAMFQAVCENLLIKNGYVGFITPTSWMFSPKFSKIREKVVANMQFDSLVNCGTELFDGKIGHLYIVAWVNKNTRPWKPAIAIDLSEFNYSRKNEKIREFYNQKNKYVFDQRKFSLLPDTPVAYSVSQDVLKWFNCNEILGDRGTARQGLTTSDNNKFVRNWYEVNFETIGFNITSVNDTQNCVYKWFPFIKGGDFQRWYPRHDFIVNYANDGRDIKKSVLKKYTYLSNPGFVVKNTDWYFKSGITWNDVEGDRFNARYSPNGYIFADASPSYFPMDGDNWLCLGYFNSIVFQRFADIICQGLHYSTGQIPKIPYIKLSEEKANEVRQLAKNSYHILQSIHQKNETEWDFIPFKVTGKEYKSISDQCEFIHDYIDQSKEKLSCNEERINEIYIEAAGLANELHAKSEELATSLGKYDEDVVVKKILSFAVGCIFGRYSLDVDGLAYAGGDWDSSKYSTFIPDADNVIPITDEDYFDDDIVGLLIKWLKKVYGEETLEENLDFIAKALGNKGNTSREIIRNYFLTDFFKDHCRTYSVTGSGKRPIYWLYDSGKQNGFKALIYMHRYNEDTTGVVRVKYLHRMEQIYMSEIDRMQDMMDHSKSAHDVSVASKRKEKLQKQLKECKDYDEKISHLALDRIAIDLDDGVKVNYRKVQTGSDGKFYEVLADSKNIMKKE